MVVEQETVSLSNPRQGEPAFTGDRLLQDLHTCISCPCSSVIVHRVQLPHEPQFPFTNKKIIDVVVYG
jgi:hypothetical protein